MKSVSENLKMNAALLSRFDLVFILMDKPDLEKDNMISEHILRTHQLAFGEERELRHRKSPLSHCPCIIHDTRSSTVYPSLPVTDPKVTRSGLESRLPP